MRAVVQRVLRASVSVEGQVVGDCGPGLVALVAAKSGDEKENAHRMADRIFGLRIFNDAQGKINLTLSDACSQSGTNVLAISNFTVYGETAKNRRPSFVQAAKYEEGEALFQAFVEELERLGARVATGIFGADMQVELVNDGPVTVIVET